MLDHSHENEVRVLLIADTHGQIHPNITAIAQTADIVVHAGDIGHPSILAQLAETAPTVHVVRGNNDTTDKWPIENRVALDALQLRLELKLPGGMLAVEHGDKVNPVSQRHTKLRDRYQNARLVLYGHSHRQIIDDATEPWIVNPGAAGRSRTYGGPACIVLNAQKDRWVLTPHRFALTDWKR